jgi:hypothetical protein
MKLYVNNILFQEVWGWGLNKIFRKNSETLRVNHIPGIPLVWACDTTND